MQKSYNPIKKSTKKFNNPFKKVQKIKKSYKNFKYLKLLKKISKKIKKILNNPPYKKWILNFHI